MSPIPLTHDIRGCTAKEHFVIGGVRCNRRILRCPQTRIPYWVGSIRSCKIGHEMSPLFTATTGSFAYDTYAVPGSNQHNNQCNSGTARIANSHPCQHGFATLRIWKRGLVQ